jgi:transposase
MQKKFIVRLTDEERSQLREVVRKLNGTSQKVKRAQILLKADAAGPGWTDRRIAEAFDCRVQTVEDVRQRLVERGFDETLDGAKRVQPTTPKLLDGKQEAQVIAMRLGKPPKGYANWTLRLLARKVVELAIVETVSYETVRRTLKKTT